MNRYTNLSFNSLNDLPQLSLPYQQLDELLGSKQKQIDLFNASSDLRPDYRQDSQYDRQLANEIIQYQQQVKDQLGQLASTGNVNQYLSGLSQAQQNIKRLYQPGGAADALRQRKLQAEAEDKRLDEQYKDNPTWADYYKKNRQYNEVGYNPATGEYKPLSSLGQTTKYVDPKEITNFANTYLDNIKETLLLDDKGQPITGKDKIYLDSITNVYDLYNLKGVTKDRIVRAMAQVLPKEYIQSMYTQHQIDRFYNPNIQPLDERITIEKNGKEILNPDNPVARQLEGWAEIGARVNKDGQRIKVTNEKALAKYKHDLDNPFVPPTSGKTNAVTNPFLQDFYPIEMDKNGQIKEKSQNVENAEAKKKALSSKIDEMRRARIPENKIQEYIKNEEKEITKLSGEFTEDKKELLNDIKNRFIDLYTPIDDDKKREWKQKYGEDKMNEIAIKAYNDLISDRKSSAITFQQINDPKELKRLNDRVLGSEKNILNVGSRPVYFLDSNGKASRPMSAQDAIERLGTDILDKGIEGKISADNPIEAPTGDYATAIDKDGNFVTMIIGNRSIEEDQHFQDIHLLSRPKYSLKDEVVVIRDKNNVPTGEKAIASPVIDVDENGNYRGVGVEVEYFDVFGKSKGKISLDELKSYKEQTNPYK